MLNKVNYLCIQNYKEIFFAAGCVISTSTQTIAIKTIRDVWHIHLKSPYCEYSSWVLLLE